MSDWSYISPQVGLSPVSIQSGAVPQASLHLKPPSDRASSSSNSLLEEDKETAASLQVAFPCLQRLDSLGEDVDRNINGSSSVSREESVHSSAFGNGLGAQGMPQVDDKTHQVFSSLMRCVSSDESSSSTSQSPLPVPSLSTEQLPVVPNQYNSPSDSSSLLENTNATVLSANRCLSPTSNSTTPQFPSEPTILAGKYVVLGPVDSATSHALRISNHQPVHVKSVSVRTAHEVCGQQALLGFCDGARAPLEAVVSACGKRAWLVFRPHFGDLHSYVRLRRRLREAEAQRLFSQVVRTVASCHEAGLVLRDLKLRKFVFSDTNREHVVLESVEDSVVAGESDLLHDKHGCPAYVAPEILSAAAYSGRHADMWGLGVILYTMLVGRYPFHNADTSTLFARIRSGKFFIPDWVSSRARHLILSLLRRHPHRRLSAAQVLLHPWLNRAPRDHVTREALDQVVPGDQVVLRVSHSTGKPRPP